MLRRRSAVLVVPKEIVGHNLIFRHYTNKVVVGKYMHTKDAAEALKPKKKANKSIR